MRRAMLVALALTIGAAVSLPGAGDAQAEAERPPGRAAPPAPTTEEPSADALAREAVEKLIQALSVLLQSLPQYELPQINEDGDIIIRRIKRKPTPGPAPKVPAPARPYRPEPEDGTRT